MAHILAILMQVEGSDPLSLALFNILFDVLSKIISREEEVGRIHGIKFSRTSPSISHLIYADDLVIYYRAIVEEAEAILSCLNLFCSWFGQAINFGKFSVHFSSNTMLEVKSEII